MSTIAKALEIQEATRDGMMNFEVMTSAAHLYQTALNNPTAEELQELIFKYSALLSASVSTRVVSVLMTESDFNSMVDQINEFDEIANNVLGENN